MGGRSGFHLQHRHRPGSDASTRCVRSSVFDWWSAAHVVSLWYSQHVEASDARDRTTLPFYLQTAPDCLQGWLMRKKRHVNKLSKVTWVRRYCWLTFRQGVWLLEYAASPTGDVRHNVRAADVLFVVASSHTTFTTLPITCVSRSWSSIKVSSCNCLVSSPRLRRTAWR